jgi:hypothetical protein
MAGRASLTRSRLVLAVVGVLVIASAIIAVVARPWDRESAADKASGDLQARIAANEQTWQKAGVANYRITLKESRSSLAPVSYTVVLTVQGGRVVDRQLVDCRLGGAPCAPGFPSTGEMDGYTVPGLFSYAHGLATAKDVPPTIEFDAKYGFPSTITLPALPDRGGSRVVMQFDPLP